MPNLQEPPLWVKLKRLGTAVVYLQNSDLSQKEKDKIRKDFNKLLEFINKEFSTSRVNRLVADEWRRRKK